MGLIITYPPHNDESGMGYYRRLSADNALFGWRNLAGAAGVERQRRTLMMCTDDVAHNLGLDPAWAEFARQKEELCRDWSRLHRTQSDAVCPACMAESPYLRHSWEHAYVTACPKHHILLVDQCNACGEQLFTGVNLLTGWHLMMISCSGRPGAVTSSFVHFRT